MASKRLFLDTNILLELLLPGRQKTKACEEYITSFKGVVVISVLSVHIVHYFSKKQGHSIEQTNAFLSAFEVFALNRDDYAEALRIVSDNDLEGALQISVACKAECGIFLTLDKKLANRYSKNIKIELL